MGTACMQGNHLARRRSSFLELTESTTVCGDMERGVEGVGGKRGGGAIAASGTV